MEMLNDDVIVLKTEKMDICGVETEVKTGLTLTENGEKSTIIAENPEYKYVQIIENDSHAHEGLSFGGKKFYRDFGFRNGKRFSSGWSQLVMESKLKKCANCVNRELDARAKTIAFALVGRFNKNLTK